MNFAHDTHVFAESIVLFSEESILFFQLNVLIEETFCLFMVSGVAETGLSFLKRWSLGEAWFFGEPESISSDNFGRGLR